MAVDLGKLVAEVKQQIEFDELSDKRIAIDAYNTIYQFLSIIRQPDGTPLTDSKGRVTSHLSGLFYRTMNLLEYGIRPVYIFDGIPSHLKRKTIEARMNRREEARKQWEEAKEKGLVEEARIHAMASTSINKEIVQGSKNLLDYMGIPWIQAPGEGEAEGAYLSRKGLVYAEASQDYDSFLFGSEVVIRNFAITGRRKLPKKNVFINVSLERVFLKDLLKRWEIDRRQLILIGMLMGTDFNSGIEKVGPKTALKIATENKTVEKVVEYIKEKYGAEFDADPYEVLEIFEKPEVKEMNDKEFDGILQGKKPDSDSITRFMCDEHGFSYERIKKFADRLMELSGVSGQKNMSSWFK